MSKQVKAGPTKRFFVEMLTRDIELADAILDLLDNCVDGVVRDLKGKQAHGNGNPDKPYTGYWAKIVAKPDKFEIWDNCGGIPEKIALLSAFMLGRPDLERDSEIETVGMYGIGMKRAMFKMGRHSKVVSKPKNEDAYQVEIPPEWLEDTDQANDGAEQENYDPWKLELVKCDAGFEENGTKITVTQLKPEISVQFDQTKTSFLDDLEKEISRHYALIISKGFEVKLNDEIVAPAELTILSPDNIGTAEGPAIEPYVFSGVLDGVQVELAVGFYRPLVTEKELEDEEKVSSSRENAGWTIICNDRVVLYNDKSYKTGWGVKGVTPGYHNQFISIAGIVMFRSNESMKLPLNTTKRGLDRDSELYNMVLGYMMEGLKKFTSFTNHWKKREEETQLEFRQMHAQKSTEISKKIPDDKFSDVAKVKDRGQARRYTPNLPKPTKEQRQLRISFAADKDDITIVAEYYFDDAKKPVAEVGKRCFEESLDRAKRAA